MIMLPTSKRRVIDVIRQAQSLGMRVVSRNHKLVMVK